MSVVFERLGASSEEDSPLVNVRDHGAAGDGAADDTAAIAAAVASLPAYAAGLGGGTVYFPAGTYRITSPIALGSGDRLVGDGKTASIISGPLASSLVTVTGAYGGLDGMMLYNSSASASARCMTMSGASNWTMHGCTFQSNGGYAVHMTATTLMTDFVSCAFACFPTSGADLGLLIDNVGGGCNVIRLRDCSFRATKGGVRVLGARALTVSGCHFEGLGGGLGTYPAGLALDNVLGASVCGNYWENMPSAGIQVANTVGLSQALQIDGNWLSLCGVTGSAPFVDLLGMTLSYIGDTVMTPGAGAPNVVGIQAAAASVNNHYGPAKMVTGSGAVLSLASGLAHTRTDGTAVTASGTVVGGSGQATGLTLNQDFIQATGTNAVQNIYARCKGAGAAFQVNMHNSSGTGGLIVGDGAATVASVFWVDSTGAIAKLSGQLTATIRAGAGTPEGAVAAGVGSLYLRTDGGAGTSLYVKESGAGSTGWVGK